MGLLNRIRRITLERVDGLLTAIENPDMLFPQLVRELESENKSACAAEKTAMRAFLAQQRRVDALVGQRVRFENAVAAGGGEWARALEPHLRATELEWAAEEEALARAYEIYLETTAARLELENVLVRMEARREEMLERAREGKPIREIAELAARSPGKGRLSSLLDRVGKIMDLPDQDKTKVRSKPQDIPLDLRIYQQKHPQGVPP